MPITSAGLVVTPAAERIAAARAALDANVGTPLDYDDTLEGALTETWGTLAFDVESGQAILLDATTPERATGANLDRLLGPLIPRRPATRTRQTFRAVASSTITLPPGYTVQFVDADGVARVWETVEDTTVTTSATAVVYEAQDDGPIVVDSTQTGQIVRPFPGLSSVSWTSPSSDAISLGRLRESDTEYRIRGRLTRATAAGPTEPGIRSALLRIPWVRAQSLARTGAAQVGVTVVPAPVGADQIAQLAQTIADVVGLPASTTGSSSTTVTFPGGWTDTVRWTVGTTSNVAVVAVVALETGVALADIRPAILDSIAGVFAALDVGDPLRYGRVFCAIMEVSGVVGVTTLTLNGGTADITPLSTQLLVASPTPAVT